MESDFCGGFGRTSFRTSPRPTAAAAVFVRGAGEGFVRKTAGAGAGEEFSAGRFSLVDGSLPAIFSDVFAVGIAAGCVSAGSTGFESAGFSPVTEAEVEEGWLRKLKIRGMAKISPANTAAPRSTGTR